MADKTAQCSAESRLTEAEVRDFMEKFKALEAGPHRAPHRVPFPGEGSESQRTYQRSDRGIADPLLAAKFRQAASLLFKICEEVDVGVPPPCVPDGTGISPPGRGPDGAGVSPPGRGPDNAGI